MKIYQKEIARFNDSANNIYKDKFQLEMDKLAMIRLYTMIEKRGFYIKVREDIVECLEDIRFELQMNYKTKSENSIDKSLKRNLI